MIRNYLVTAFRNLLRNKGLTFINIFGLSIGIATCVIIFLYVRFELRYDRFHKEYKRIYRVEKNSNIYGKNEKYAAIPVFIGNALRDYEEVEYLGRFGSWRSSTVRYKDIAFKEENIKPIEPDFINYMFQFHESFHR